MMMLPRLKAGMAAAVTGTLLVALIAAHFGLMTAKGVWLQLMLPAVLLVLGHVLLTTKRFLMTERGKERSEAESLSMCRSSISRANALLASSKTCSASLREPLSRAPSPSKNVA